MQRRVVSLGSTRRLARDEQSVDHDLGGRMSSEGLRLSQAREAIHRHKLEKREGDEEVGERGMKEKR